MIGVALAPRDLAVAREFFELFKTPWEPAVSGKKYSVLVGAGGSHANIDADLTIIYSSRPDESDRELGVVVEPDRSANVSWEGVSLPIFGNIATFRSVSDARLTVDGKALDCRRQVGERHVHRVGYDLFSEIAHLLTSGQPASHAMT